MAKKRGSSQTPSSPGPISDDYDLPPGGSGVPFENPSVPLLPTLSPLSVNDPLSEIEDRRSYHPLGRARPAIYATGALKLKDRSPSKLQKKYGFRPRSQTNAILTFHRPSQVALCVRRKQRREILFAKRRTGGGGRGPRRRNWTTQISCR